MCDRSIAERSKHRGAIFEASRASRSDAIEDRGVIEASRSDAPGDRSIAKRCYRRSRSDRSIAKRCSRGIADDDAPGVKGRSPPRASSSSDCRCPPSLLQLPSRVSIYLYNSMTLPFQRLSCSVYLFFASLAGK